MKRKNEAQGSNDANGREAKRAAVDQDVELHFRPGLFDDSTLREYTTSYAASEP